LSPHRFIAIEGNIGTGKTTLCQMLQQDMGCALVLEQFTDNPFLPFFYKHPERYAFPVELFFMTERHKQLQEHFAQEDVAAKLTIADYFFVKTQLFAKNNLSEAEYELFSRLFYALNVGFPKPDLLVFLHRPVDVILSQIKKRGREMEADITGEYLESIQAAYDAHLRTETDVPILRLDLGAADYVSDPERYSELKHLLNQTYPKGTTTIKLGESIKMTDHHGA
jgi:deoxyguanosine kinase